MTKAYIAVDFGGGSGRVIAGFFRPTPGIGNGTTLTLREIHRFPNRQVRIGDYLFWDFPALFAEMKEGLRKAARTGYEIVSIGIDTWGVDFGLIDRLGMLTGNPVCYRDNHTEGLPEEFFRTVSPEAHYAEAGIQVLPINTLFRLLAMKKAGDPKLEIAERLLFMPDLFSYYLTGVANCEYTIASTSELLDARTRDWNFPLIESLGLPRRIFGEIVMPGTVRGTILPEIAAETGLSPDVKVIAVGSHDTASAIFACESDYATDRSAFLSSGTWSLFGVEIPSPILTEAARRADYTNEGSVKGIKFLQNITGLWILQRLVDGWKKDGLDTDYSRLVAEAEKAADTALLDVDDPCFQKPEDMAGTITAYCQRHGLTPPATQGEFVRCVCRSLAERYRKAVEQLNPLLPHPIERINVIGGGSKNALLNRLTAEATGLEVTVGASEATAVGNIRLQAIAAGEKADRFDTEVIPAG